jgi:hypothetical protein
MMRCTIPVLGSSRRYRLFEQAWRNGKCAHRRNPTIGLSERFPHRDSGSRAAPIILRDAGRCSLLRERMTRRLDRSADVARLKNADSPARASDAPDSVAAVLWSPGESLDAPRRAALRSRFDHDFSAVRVLTVGAPATAAASFGARAFSSARHRVRRVAARSRTTPLHARSAHVAHADLIGTAARNSPAATSLELTFA